jgi:hypothetical protein
MSVGTWISPPTVPAPSSPAVPRWPSCCPSGSGSSAPCWTGPRGPRPGRELYGSNRIEHTLGLLSEPYREGRAGALLRTGRRLTALGVVGALLGRRSRVASALSGAALLVASLATRFGIFDGGVASAEDPRYTVVPQRTRRERRESATADP